MSTNVSGPVGPHELDIDALESEDEDLANQDQFKGRNLAAINITKKRDMTTAQRLAWWNKDDNEGRVAMALKNDPDRDYVRRVHANQRAKTQRLRAEEGTKSEI